jgi:DNA-binding NarL/FixJ family response regulator
VASAVKPSIRINEYVTWRARGKWSAGGAAMSPEVAQRVIQLFRDIRPPAHADYHLTPHETRLLTLLMDGHNFNTAAAETGVSPRTVAWHMRRIYDKLHVHSKSEAVAKVLRERIV